MATLELLSTGLCTLVVDQGRPVTRAQGVPMGGAADRRSLALGNALVNNPPFTPALEITLAGPTLVAAEPLVLALSGAPFEIKLGETSLTINKPFLLPPKMNLKIGGTSRGVRAYLCARGGLHYRDILGSESSLAPLARGDTLTCATSDQVPKRFLASALNDIETPVTLRALPGAQHDWFNLDLFTAQSFAVSPSSNRMGIRLDGVKLPPLQKEMTSEPVCPGSVQVTREGQCIILGVDGQTIGGYPKIAQVASVDLDKLGQLRPGDEIRFQWITLDEAEVLWQEREADLRQWLTRLESML